MTRDSGVPESPTDQQDRGLGYQALGFAVVGFISLVLLEICRDCDGWMYESFETAVTRLHWAFAVALAGIIDRGRKMFETRKAIREQALQNQVKKEVDRKLGYILENWDGLRTLDRDALKKKILEQESTEGNSI